MASSVHYEGNTLRRDNKEMYGPGVSSFNEAQKTMDRDQSKHLYRDDPSDPRSEDSAFDVPRRDRQTTTGDELRSSARLTVSRPKHGSTGVGLPTPDTCSFVCFRFFEFF